MFYSVVETVLFYEAGLKISSYLVLTLGLYL